MRILLDEQLSPRYVGEPLAARGHDVVCIAGNPPHEGASDEAVLALAAESGRILVTRNARHFVPLAREWAERGRPHAGLLLVWSRETDEFGALVDEVTAVLASVDDQDGWTNLTLSM